MGKLVSNYYAGCPDRIIAYILDLLIVGIPIYMLFMSILLILASLHFDVSQESFSFSVYVATVLIGYLLYFAYFDSSEKQATFGKQAAKIIVTDLDGNRITFLRSLLRTPFKILFATFGILGLLNVIVIAVTKNKRGIHDYIAGTLVLKKDYHLPEEEVAP